MEDTLNASACAALFEEVHWTRVEVLFLLVVLCFINIIVIVGNCLVIAAVFTSPKLRSVTNLFIASLAVADLLVGLAVLPFATSLEIFDVWIFGKVWCKLWLAIDVWMCTSSILNVCVISLDRYLAVTRPINYPTLMTRLRAKILIVIIWVLSFFICFPPLVGWRDSEKAGGNSSEAEENPPCPWKCELTNQPGYVVYSALGSFFIPMFAILFFYFRIYETAVTTTQAINQGFRTTTGGVGNRLDDQRLTLRIHRGRSSSDKRHALQHANGSSSTIATGSTTSSPRGKHPRVKINVSYASCENISTQPTANNQNVSSAGPSTGQPTYTVHYTANGKETTSTKLYKEDTHLSVSPKGESQGHCSRRSSSYNNIDTLPSRSPSPRHCEEGLSTPKMISKSMGNLKAQAKRFQMETKAAKTLGIIVGCFIFCWLPFFTMYLIRAFCKVCIHPLVFSVLFWLGYCNSALNPLIYALFSKDFRFAFKKIIRKCFCRNEDEFVSRRGSDMSRLHGRQHRSRLSSHQQAGHSLEYDSDPVDPSDSK